MREASRAALLLPLLLAAVVGPVRAAPPSLTVSAAANLSGAFSEAARSFEQSAGIRVLLNFGSTGELAQQIEQGAPVDLFAAANIADIERLERMGLLAAGTKRLYARGRLVLWSRADAPFRLERLEDLALPQVKRFAISNPERSPYGAAAREALEARGLWATLRPKLILAETVNQALQYAETGNVEAALAARALCAEGQGRWSLVPQELHRPIDQALAVVRGCKHEIEARRFSDFITGPEGQAILRAFGYEN